MTTERMNDTTFDLLADDAGVAACDLLVAEARRARESEAAALTLLERLYTAEPEFEPWDEVYPMIMKAGRR